MSMHFIVHFEPKPGNEAAFREEMLRSVNASQDEAGCLAIRAYESLGEPRHFAIHSEWVDEAAFNMHAELPHTVRFLRSAEALLAHSVSGLRSHEIGGGDGRGAR